MSTEREQTFGEKLVRLNFNPSAKDNVSTIKKTFADAADLIHNYYVDPIFNGASVTQEETNNYNDAINAIKVASMQSVYLLTANLGK